MTYYELKAHAEKLDKMLGPEPFTSAHGSTDAAILRATLEVALQLADLNNNGISIAGIQQRGDSLCVSIEHNNG